MPYFSGHFPQKSPKEPSKLWLFRGKSPAPEIELGNRDLFHEIELGDSNWLLQSSTCYRVAKTHRMPYVYRSFSVKEPCT